MEENIDCICDHYRERGIYTGNISWIEVLKSKGITVFGDSGLNVYNSYSEEVYENMGVEHCVGSLEEVEEGFGPIQLMVTEYKPDAEWLLDRKKKKALFLKRKYSDQTLILSGEKTLEMGEIKTKLNNTDGIVRIFII